MTESAAPNTRGEEGPGNYLRWRLRMRKFTASLVGEIAMSRRTVHPTPARRPPLLRGNSSGSSSSSLLSGGGSGSKLLDDVGGADERHAHSPIGTDAAMRRYVDRQPAPACSTDEPTPLKSEGSRRSIGLVQRRWRAVNAAALQPPPPPTQPPPHGACPDDEDECTCSDPVGICSVCILALVALAWTGFVMFAVIKGVAWASGEQFGLRNVTSGARTAMRLASTGELFVRLGTP